MRWPSAAAWTKAMSLPPGWMSGSRPRSLSTSTRLLADFVGKISARHVAGSCAIRPSKARLASSHASDAHSAGCQRQFPEFRDPGREASRPTGRFCWKKCCMARRRKLRHPPGESSLGAVACLRRRAFLARRQTADWRHLAYFRSYFLEKAKLSFRTCGMYGLT